ncbi:MAG TPA: DUF5695 domain-containing protein [Terriglobales bacterium]|nr:DUF5695 domain-containing protein [Terriglobales bacterium]
MPSVSGAQEQPAKPAPVPGPMLNQGTIEIDTPQLVLRLVKSSQTVAALIPKKEPGFDFTPGDLLLQRSHDGYYHLGDLDLRMRTGTSGEWKSYSTAVRRTPITPLPARQGVLASADISPAFGDVPLQITRSWLLADGHLTLRFTFKNATNLPVQIGALGIPMVFNNVLNERSLEQAHAVCSFYDPYIGEDAGYLQVTRLNGHGPALLVVPDGRTPFEAYNPILGPRRESTGPAPIFTDPTPRGMTFEGFYDWMVLSQAFAENEWAKAQPWNPSTMVTLSPGESKSYGVRFLVSESIRAIEPTLAAAGRPVAVGIPGYVLPQDMEGKLFLKYRHAMRSMRVEPESALEIRRLGKKAGGDEYLVQGKKWGRARLLITYENGVQQAIHYFVTKPAAETVADMGRFLTHQQWFVDAKDPFHRSPSVMSYDRELNQIVTQDSRVWISGLGDEAGSGSWLAAIMKELGQPDKEELDRYQRFVDGVLWGGLQYSNGPYKYGVRKSLMYYEPSELPPGYYRSDLNWKSWTSWNKPHSELVERSFNYPHVVAAYWVLYRLARNHTGLVTNHAWDWYLQQAYETSIAMTKFAEGYAEFGQMEGDVFLQVLQDLKRENLTKEANSLEAAMMKRADRWNGQAYPFGSEMPWDSTGQEEVYAWTKYFGYRDKTAVTLDAILGYMPTVPHWAYNGSARRFWDFLYAGKYPRLERQLHHYGSGINAIPVLSEYRDHPDDLYLLRVGYGGTMGAITNIDRDGFASAAFHGFPDMLNFDPYSGDYGPNFFGHAINAATYVVKTDAYGWLSFGGNLKVTDGVVTVKPLDSFRSRIYVAVLGLWLTLDAGQFEEVEVNPRTKTVRVALSTATEFTPSAILRIEQPSAVRKMGKIGPISEFRQERGAFVVPLTKDGPTWVTLATQP